MTDERRGLLIAVRNLDALRDDATRLARTGRALISVEDDELAAEFMATTAAFLDSLDVWMFDRQQRLLRLARTL